jgi:hypothetical protein
VDDSPKTITCVECDSLPARHIVLDEDTVRLICPACVIQMLADAYRLDETLVVSVRTARDVALDI